MQQPPPAFTENTISTTANGAQDVVFADVDGDGDLDVLSASFLDDKIAWYENDGSEVFTEGVISTTADSANSVSVADVDGDGDLDVLSASVIDGKIAWYENDGSEVFTERVISTTADGAYSLSVADVDGDGDLDVLSASFFNDKIAWYENDGSEVFTERVISTTADGATSVSVADVDDDGDLDVLSASGADDKIAWYENDGSEAFTERVISTTADYAFSVSVADVDGDGDLDVLSASANDDKIAWYENDGSEVFTERVISTTADGARSVKVADVDGDGDLDVLSASYLDDKIAWYENDGSEVFTERVISTSADSARSVNVADVDGDGDLDVLSASSTDDKIAWYENTGQTFTNTLDGNPTFVEGGAVVVLDSDVDVSDAELDALNGGLGDYDVASVTLGRTVTINSDDVFAFNDGNGITLSGANLIKNSQIIASFDITTTAGELVIAFTNANGETATSVDVDNILRQITYANSSHIPPTSVQLDWTFDDGNITAQGSGGPQQAAGSTTVDITPVEGGISVSVNGSGEFGLQAQASQSPTSGDATYLSQAVVLNNDGSYVLVWAAASDGDGQGVYSQRYDALGSPLGAETRVNTTVTGSQYYASVAMDDAGNYVVVWQGEGTGDTTGVFGQRFNANGVAQGSEFLVNTTTTGDQDYSSVAMDSVGNFVVVWEGEGTGDGSGVFARRYDASGSALGSEFLINSTTTDLQQFGEVSMDSEGNFTVTWTSRNQDGSDRGVYVKRFDADGVAITGEIQVDTDTLGNQWISQIDVNDAGNFVVVWRDDGATDTIQAQLFNADGSKNGSEIIVSDQPDLNDNYPAVRIGQDGSFVVVWEGQHDGNDYGILARSFDSSGTAIGPSFIVNSSTDGGQEYPAISMNDSGQFVIAFEDWTAGTVESRVYGLATSESGGTASVDVVLDAAPTADVTIAVSMPDTSEGSLSTNLLTFTDSNWNTPQTVTITGISDSLNDGDIRHLLVFDPASSTDLNYDGLDAEDLMVSNLDNNPLVDLDEDDSISAGVDFSVTYVENTVPVRIVDTDAVISDPDSSNLDSLVVTITNMLDGADEVLAADTSGTSITAGFVGGVLTLSGTDTVAHYQQVLRTVTYENATTEPDKTNRSITFVVNDGTHSSEVATTTLSINNAADLSIIAPATATTDEDTQFVYSGANVISVDDGIVADTPIQVSLSVTNGILTLADQTGITFVEGADGSANFVVEGLESDMNTTLDGLIFTPNTNYNGADTLSISTAIAAGLEGHYTFDDTTANDSSAGTTQHGTFNGTAATTNNIDRGEVLTLDGTDDSVQISGTYSDPANVTLAAWVDLSSADTNGAEVISLGDNVVLRVDDSVLGGLIGYYFDGSSLVDVTASGVTVAGTGWNHVAYVFDDVNDSHTVYLNGVAIASSMTTGSIAYANGANTFIGSHGNGDANYDFNGLIDHAHIYSRALTVDEIAALATDQTEASDSVAITVTSVNDDPVITSNGGATTAAISVDENQTVVTTVTATDVDDSDTQAYSITGGTDAASFSIVSGTGALTFNTAPDHETKDTYVVEVTVTDSGSLTDTQLITVTIDDVNEAPVITSNGGAATAAVSVDENQTAVTTVTATDVDDSDTQAYSITGGVDQAAFSINASTGALTFNTSADFETPGDTDSNNVYNVTVQVTDANGGIDTQAIAVTVTNVNEAPAITSDGGGALAAISITENQTAVTTVTSTDVDGGPPTYSIVGGTDAGLFSINGISGALTFNTEPDFESPGDIGANNIYDVTVQVADGHGGTTTQDISISITNVNEAPVIDGALVVDGGGIIVDTCSSDTVVNISLNENQTWVMQIPAADADADDTHTYSLTGGADQSAFVIDSNTGDLTFVEAPDHEVQERFEVEVTVTDNGGLKAIQRLVINIQDINESPTAHTDNLEADENQQLIIDPVSSLLANDEDPEQDALQLVSFTQPQNGTLTLNSQGLLVYTPNDHFVGQDWFDYVVEDQGDHQVEARVWLDVIALSDPQLAGAQPVDGGDDKAGESTLNKPAASRPDVQATEPAASFTSEPTSKETSVSEESDASAESMTTKITGTEDFYIASASNVVNEQGLGIVNQPLPSRAFAPIISDLLQQLIEYELNELDIGFELEYTEASQSVEQRNTILALRNQIDQIYDQSNEPSALVTYSPTVVGASLTVGMVTWVLRSGLLLSATITASPLWLPLDPVPILTRLDDDEPWYEDAKSG